MNRTLFVDDEVVKQDLDAAEFERLSRSSGGNSAGWKFNRDELHRTLQHHRPRLTR